MFLPRKIKKIIKLLRGQVSPVLAGISVGLGFWFGLMPGFSGIHALMLVMLLLLNVPIGLFILFIGIGKAASLAAAPLLYHAGDFVQATLPGLLAFFQKVPIAGLTDFSRLALIGALLLGPLCGILIGAAFGAMIMSFRKTWLKLETNKEKFNVWYNKRWVKILDRIMVGKRGAKDARQALEAKTKYIRKVGAALAILLLLILLVFSMLFQKQYIRNKAEVKLTEANGATVDIEELSLSTVSGKLKVAGLGITDRTDPVKNAVQVGELSTQASMYQLSLGKLVMDEVKVSEVRFGQTRATPGQVLPKAGADGEEGTSDTSSKKDGTIPDVNATDLERYMDKYEELKAWLEKIRPWLPQGEGAEVPEEAPHRYLDYLKAKGGPEAAVRMLAKQVIMEKVVLPDKQFGSSNIKLTNLNDAPTTAKLPIGLDIESEQGPKMQVQMHFDDPNQPGRVTGTFDAFDLSKLQSSLKNDNALRFDAGKAAGQIEGHITRETIDLTIGANLTDLQSSAPGGLFGLDAKTTQEALKTLDKLGVSIRVSGALSDPKISFDTGNLKDQIVAAGKKRVMQEIEKQINDKAPDELKKLMDSNDVKKGLDKLLKF